MYPLIRCPYLFATLDGASKEVSCVVELGLVLTRIDETDVPDIFDQYSLKMLPVAVQVPAVLVD